MKEKDRQRIIKETEESLCERQSLSWGLLQGHEDVSHVLSGPSGAPSEDFQ